MDPLRELDNCHYLAYRRSDRFITRLYDRHLSRAALTSSQFTLLMSLKVSPGIGAIALADAMVMERTTLVRALKPMRDAGWVEASASGAGRGIAFKLTKAGHAKVDEGYPLWAAAKKEFEDTVGESKANRIRTSNLTVARLAQA